MLVGLFIVKPVPPHATSSYALAGGYDFVPSEDNFALVGVAQAALDTEAEVEEEADSALLLSHEQRFSSDLAPLPPSAIGLNSPVSLHREKSIEDKDGLPDIHGMQLWVTPDFHLVLMIIGICA